MKLFYSGWAVVATILLLTVIKVVDPTPLQSLRLQTFDALQTLDEVKQSDEVVLAPIPKQAAACEPYPRERHVDPAHSEAGARAKIFQQRSRQRWDCCLIGPRPLWPGLLVADGTQMLRTQSATKVL